MKNYNILFKIKGDLLYAKTLQKEDSPWYIVTAGTYITTPDRLEIPEKKTSECFSETSLKIRLSGRLKGVSMARKYEEHTGAGLRTQSLAWAIEEDKRQIFTKWGTIGIKVSRGGGKER